MHLYPVISSAKTVSMVNLLAYAEVLLFVTVCFSSYLTPATVADSPSLRVIVVSAKTQVTLVGGEVMELHVKSEDEFSDL